MQPRRPLNDARIALDPAFLAHWRRSESPGDAIPLQSRDLSRGPPLARPVNAEDFRSHRLTPRPISPFCDSLLYEVF